MNNDEITAIIDVVKSCDDVVLGTNRLDGYPECRTVMNALNADVTDLKLHFITNGDSPKMAQLRHNAKCCLYYFNSNTRYAVRLFGEMRVIDNLDEKKKYWRDSYSEFGYTGADDANLTLLEFVPKSYKFYVGNEMKTGLV
ncbi:MAG: pyridoxamine 5'-phosphate oxidase family protein [Proteobacteria bacterium]|uniref:Pyridoxamine 5'-phosphate oxidase family protein n=1 Tax=Candidatus Enterousia avistercoris TaxID=2840788 RepID=A0A9D9GUD8_9PROT|nr:pyridoxamine 5'-phosphate oxidase family protein [Candidatus Enterousia avistercoris]